MPHLKVTSGEYLRDAQCYSAQRSPWFALEGPVHGKADRVQPVFHYVVESVEKKHIYLCHYYSLSAANAVFTAARVALGLSPT